MSLWVIRGRDVAHLSAFHVRFSNRADWGFKRISDYQTQAQCRCRLAGLRFALFSGNFRAQGPSIFMGFSRTRGRNNYFTAGPCVLQTGRFPRREHAGTRLYHRPQGGTIMTTGRWGGLRVFLPIPVWNPAVGSQWLLRFPGFHRNSVAVNPDCGAGITAKPGAPAAPRPAFLIPSLALAILHAHAWRPRPFRPDARQQWYGPLREAPPHQSRLRTLIISAAGFGLTFRPELGFTGGKGASGNQKRTAPTGLGVSEAGAGYVTTWAADRSSRPPQGPTRAPVISAPAHIIIGGHRWPAKRTM